MVQRSAHGTSLGATPRPHGAVGAMNGPVTDRAGLRAFLYAISRSVVGLRSAKPAVSETFAR
jgi:hypothetical protein